MSIYSPWGFEEVPFQTTALPPSAQGSHLLVGRDAELRTISRRLANPPKLVTVEGANGVGKTSLVNVASFRAYEAFLSGAPGPLFVPCGRTFQLSPSKTIPEFRDEVILGIAQTLIRHSDSVRETATLQNRIQLDRWLNSPMLSAVGGSVGGSVAGAFGVNLGGSRSDAVNTSAGFRASGLVDLVKAWLEEMFGGNDAGGVVCIIDNLELLQTSAEARRQLEELRDELLVVRGIRWVLCGALGVVHSVASSPRLEGLLHTPIEVGGISDRFAGTVFQSRVEAFAAVEQPYLPLSGDDFVALYSILHGNLRATLGHSDSYCNWVADHAADRQFDEHEKREHFATWLSIESAKYADAADGIVAPRAWQVFEEAVGRGGGFSPSDFEAFGFNSLQAMRPHVRSLEEAGLVVSARDDGDRRRKTVQIAPKGWFVNWYRENS